MHFGQPLHYIAELTNRKETEHVPFIFFIFLFNYKAWTLQISNHNLLCSLDPPNQGRLALS